MKMKQEPTKTKGAGPVTDRLIIPGLFFLLLLCIPFNSGPTVKYILTIALALACIYRLFRSGQQARNILFRLLKDPVSWGIGLLALAALVSIFTSYAPSYSMRKFLEEYVLNLALFFGFSAYCSLYGRKIDWFRLIKWASVIFLCLYLALMALWVFSQPGDLLLEIQGKCDFSESTPWDRVFTYGNCNELVHGIKHTSFFLLLGIAVTFAGMVWKRELYSNIVLFSANFLTLVTTVRRAAILAAFMGLGLAAFLRRESRKYVAAALVMCVVIIVSLFLSGKGQYFMRENWDLIMQGEIEKAKELKGSVPIRILCLKMFSKEIMEHPFKGAGLGKRNIKRGFPGPCRELEIGHPHNILLNMACETGVQGAMALVLMVAAQAMMFVKCFRRAADTGTRMIMTAAIIYLFTFWMTQFFTYAFHHGTSTLYWLFMAIPTGVAIECRGKEKNGY